MRSGLGKSPFAEFCSSLKSYIHVSEITKCAVGEVYLPAECYMVFEILPEVLLQFILWKLGKNCFQTAVVPSLLENFITCI